MKNYIVTVNGVKHSVSVEETDTLQDVPVQEKVQTTVQPQVKPEVKATTDAKTTVNAPMPGVVLSVKVTVGQSVKKGDVLLVLEAMKMENEIVAPADGVVATIAVNKGVNVKTGDLLVGLN